jgi:tetratricopeptide (TPR) repeat protein
MRTRTLSSKSLSAAFLFAALVAVSSVVTFASRAIPTQRGATDQQVSSAAPEAELQAGIALTRRGQFAEAIPHFIVARGHVRDEYAASFNLALCYVGTSQFPEAIRILVELRHARQSGANSDANVENLLAQAYVGNHEDGEAFAALKRAAALAPKNEKLYLLVADACADRQNYSLGLRVVEVALNNLPVSARLHYQRAYFLAMLDQFDAAKPEFDRAVSLAPQTEVAYLAAAQRNYFAGDMPATIQAARGAIQQGHEDYLLLTILGDALVRSGVSPGQPAFAEAETSLQKAVAVRPTYSTAQIALGNLLLMEDQPATAIEHLETARQLEARNPSVYSHLAIAYRKLGKAHEADAMLAVLAKLNADEAARINSAPGERKAIPGSSAGADRPQD